MRKTLSKDSIVDACLELMSAGGSQPVSMRRLGEHLGVDATAVYRHFRNKDELLRAIGDRIHEGVVVSIPHRGTWRTVIRDTCVRLRAAHLAHPELAAFVRAGPPLHENEFAITETLLGQLRKAGLGPAEAALAYHALIELTVASAAIDAPMAARPTHEREQMYRSWRNVYAQLDPTDYPESSALSAQLYATTADDRFLYALDRMLDGIASQKRRRQSSTRQR